MRGITHDGNTWLPHGELKSQLAALSGVPKVVDGGGAADNLDFNNFRLVSNLVQIWRLVLRKQIWVSQQHPASVFFLLHSVHNSRHNQTGGNKKKQTNAQDHPLETIRICVRNRLHVGNCLTRVFAPSRLCQQQQRCCYQKMIYGLQLFFLGQVSFTPSPHSACH